MGLLERVRSGEVDTPEEVAKVLNKIIGKVNENDEYNAEVDLHNEAILETEKGAEDEG